MLIRQFKIDDSASKKYHRTFALYQKNDTIRRINEEPEESRGIYKYGSGNIPCFIPFKLELIKD